MYTRDEQKFEDVLVQLKLLTPEQIDMVKIESARSGKKFEDVLLDMNVISAENIVKAQAISMGLPYVDLSKYRVNQDILKYFKKELAIKFQAVPFSTSDGKVNIAMLDPNNVQAIEFIEKSSNMPVSAYMSSAESINNVIDQYQDLSEEVSAAIGNIGATGEVVDLSKEKENVNDLVQDAPVTRAVNTILEYAAKAKASDIHIEPREKTVKVRYRIDGVLHDTMNLPSHIHSALVSRIKILSDMKIDEHRVPQDGRFDLKAEGREIDLRVSISPTVFGEKIVIRLLDKTGGVITLEGLGVRGRAFRIIEAGAKRPHGMVLSTGPTGSGKSTTLYAILGKMNKPEVNIVTLEDPVEYQVDGVNQIQVNPNVGLTFASGLRSVLRQDPNIIMVGEIRDAETAGLAVQSALTGHTVLSTLHTNSAAGVLPRLLDMEIEPFLVASTVSTIIGQRLVRKICENCKKSYKASPAMAEAIKKTVGKYLPSRASDSKKYILELGYQNLPFKEDAEINLYKGEGCEECRGTGFSGRMGVFEVFAVTPNIEHLLQQHATTTDIQAEAIKEGMMTMREDGFLKALEGITTIEEVVSKAAEN
jgi:type IV pilus assembly protein PilB